MAGYRTILVVVDLSEDSDIIGARARDVAACYQSHVRFLHVVEFVPVEPMGETLLPAVQIEEELIQRARVRLRELTARLGMTDAECFVEAGNIKAEIVRMAQQHNADLIVLGSRERHGLAMLLNFTEDTVLHCAPCDVLAVRLR
jgi:universal stress protein A